MNDYLAILVGLGITIIVQSSSVTTSALTPLVGIGVLPVAKMLPMTLGANIGTTFTSMFAALAVMKYGSHSGSNEMGQTCLGGYPKHMDGLCHGKSRENG